MKNRSGFGEEPCDFSMYTTCLKKGQTKREDAEARGEKEREYEK